MDTDDLSIPTYKGIISEAEKFNHDLTLQFGVLASSCEDETDYLNQTEAIIKDWLQENDFEDIVDDIFFGQKANEDGFRNNLEKILSNITNIRKTPIEKRKFEDWG